MATPEAVLEPNLEKVEEARAELLKNVLRSKDKEMRERVVERLKEQMGEEAAKELLDKIARQLVEDEDFSFV